VVIDKEKARIDQVCGLAKACEMGHRNIAVSVVDPGDAGKLRAIEKERGINLILIGAHLTGLKSEDAKELIGDLDIITGCASRVVRDKVKPVIQMGISVPMFAMTQKGKELLCERAKEVESPLLINTMKLPVLPEEKQPKPLL
jgi:putative methanogenesis marker protein 8